MVRDILLYGRSHYADFQEAGEGIATNILANRLKLLVREGVVTRRKDPEHGSKRVYAVTKKGQDLLPILLEMIVWSAQYDEQSPVSAGFVQRAQGDRDGLLAELSRSAILDG